MPLTQDDVRELDLAVSELIAAKGDVEKSRIRSDRAIDKYRELLFRFQQEKETTNAVPSNEAK